MDPNLFYPQFYDMTRRFYPQFLSMIPAPSAPPSVRTAPASNDGASAPKPESKIVFVEGDAGAAAHFVPNGGNAVLFDANSDRVYVKSVDADGRPHTKVSDLVWKDFRSPDDPANRFVSIDDFNAFRSELLGELQKIASNVPKKEESPHA